ILEAYLNIIPYGRNASGANIAGIETAAEGIFNVAAKDLTLPQAAFIAGIPQAPFAHSPFTSKGELKNAEGLKPGIDRMLTVLYRMKETGYISEKDYKAAVEYDITKDFKKPEPLPYDRYPFLTIELERQAKLIISKMLAEKDNIDPERLNQETELFQKYEILADRAMRTNGYRIYSTIDKEMYDAHQAVKDAFKEYGPSKPLEVYNEEKKAYETIQTPVQVGSIMIENSTGRVISFIGGRDYSIEATNHATIPLRQNGSTMKPLLTYAPAIEYGLIGAGSPVVDVRLQGFDKGWDPKNFNNEQELGIIPARQALASSQNLATIRLYDQIIDKRPAEFLKKMKFSGLIEEDFTNHSAAIGATKNGVTIEENTNAYATLANGGQFVETYMIEKIEDVDGNIIYQHQSEAIPVYSPQTAYIITDMLRDVLSVGTGTRANGELKFQSDFAAKTGTTNDAKDVWFMGYNPSITLGVWLGYDKKNNLKTPSRSNYLQPGTRVNLLWARIMNSSYDVNPELVDPNVEFKAPKGVVSKSFCSISGLSPSDECSKAGLVTSDLFNGNTYVSNKIDDSFISSSYVMINGKRFRSLPSTPSEFVVEGGVGVNEDFINRMFGRIKGDPSKLFPKNSSFANRVVSEDTFEADGASPGGVTATLSGNRLSWTTSGSNDVVGYRVFQRSGSSNVKLASILEASGNQFTVPGSGEYFVVAVDITGKQSVSSNITKIETPTPVPIKPPAPPSGPTQPPGDGGTTPPEPPVEPPVEPPAEGEDE
ncbi:MAG: transglycosylase domain-containing protein, partial [Paenisporosarcina sp.]